MLKESMDYDIDLIDSTKLLKQYFRKISKIKMTLKNASIQINACNSFIGDLIVRTKYTTQQKITEMTQGLDAIDIKSTQYKKRFYSTDNIAIKEKSIKEFEKEIVNLKNKNSEFIEFSKAIKETAVMLKPIIGNVTEITEQIKGLKWNIRWFSSIRVVIDTIVIFAIAFILSYFLDNVQSLIKVKFDPSYFQLFMIAFMVQSFLFEPLIIRKIQSKLNWQLINKIEAKILKADKELAIAIKEFNELVGKYKELDRFIILSVNNEP